MVLFDVVAKVTEDLIERLHPLNLSGVTKTGEKKTLAIRSQHFTQILDALVFLLLQNPVAEELRSAQRLFDECVWAAINSNPAQDHDSIRNSAQVAVHWVGSV